MNSCFLAIAARLSTPSPRHPGARGHDGQNEGSTNMRTVHRTASWRALCAASTFLVLCVLAAPAAAHKLGDLVFCDTDSNGIFDPKADFGIAGVTVVRNCGGTLTTTVTNTAGRYVFVGTNAISTCQVYVDPASLPILGKLLTTPLLGVRPTNNSDTAEHTPFPSFGCGSCPNAFVTSVVADGVYQTILNNVCGCTDPACAPSGCPPTGPDPCFGPTPFDGYYGDDFGFDCAPSTTTTSTTPKTTTSSSTSSTVPITIPSSSSTSSTTTTSTITSTSNTTATTITSTSSTTTTTVACKDPVLLKTAGSYAVLAHSTVTNSGTTYVNGNLGLSPGTSVTGAPLVSGMTNKANAAAAQAQVDLAGAITDAKGRANVGGTKEGDIGGTTIGAGVYNTNSTASLAIMSGDLTLDGGGDPNALFIFRIESTLNISPDRRVLLINGAQARCVFWQVGSSATLDVRSRLQGTILATTSISLNTGAQIVYGRALAKGESDVGGAVTMLTNNITLP
jgi:hypothetical protein